jgi:hypothetical protein
MYAFLPLVDGKSCDAVGIFERDEVVHRAKYNPLQMEETLSLILDRCYVYSRFHARKTIIAAIIVTSFAEVVGA